jgi:PEGA domain-containing protein
VNRTCKVLFLAVAWGVSILWMAPPVETKDKDIGYLKTIIDPRRAGVFIDGKYLGPSANFKIASRFPVAVGDHEVKLIEPRYEEFTTTVKIEPGRTTKLREKLKARPLAQPPFGRLRTPGGVGDDKFAAVYVNGQFMGHVDEFSNSSQGLLLNPGEYTVKIVPTNGASEHQETVKIEADKVTVVRWGSNNK